MPLESITDREAHLNVKRISSDSLETKQRSNFEFEISPAEHQEIQIKLERLLQKCLDGQGDYLLLGRALAWYAQIDNSSPLQFEDSDWNGINSQIYPREGEDLFQFIHNALVSFVSIDRAQAPKLSEEEWQTMAREVNTARSKKEWVKFCMLVVDIMTMDRMRMPEITEEDWRQILVTLNEHRDPRHSANYAIPLLSDIARIAPQRLPLLEDDEWQSMKQWVKNFKSNDSAHPFGWVLYACDLSIISRAEQVLHASHHQERDEELPLPQTRNF